MSEIPAELRYTSEHEWVRVEGDVVVVGITDHAQELLDEIVFVDLPPVDAEVTAGEVFGEMDSHKTASDLFAPVTGVVVAINDALEERPELVNSSPYGDGWLIKVAPAEGTDLTALLDAAAYGDLIA